MRCTDNGTPYLLYRFKSDRTKKVYMVRVECHSNNFYGIKFYLKIHEKSKYKYNNLTRLNEPRPVINTCICILLDLYKKNPCASFGFIGSETREEKKKRELEGKSESERTETTKRMLVYRRILNTYFSSNEFEHIIDESKSAYVMVNIAELSKNQSLITDISKYFTEHYTNFD